MRGGRSRSGIGRTAWWLATLRRATLEEIDPALGVRQGDPQVTRKRQRGLPEGRAVGQEADDTLFGEDPDTFDRHELEVARLKRLGREPNGQVADGHAAMVTRVVVDHDRPTPREVEQPSTKLRLDVELDW